MYKTPVGCFKKRYINARKKLAVDESICLENRKLFEEFFEWQEYKLKRLNGLSSLDQPTYRTLCGYIRRFRAVNRFFENKPLSEITQEDIQYVYDGLEEGRILNANGVPYRSLQDYYSKIFKGKLFQLAGKDHLSRKVIQFSKHQDKEVRFILEDDFRKLIGESSHKLHKLLMWLAFDIGENINSLLQLEKRDFYLQQNPNTGEKEFRVNLRREILKRSRTARSEITLYPETVELIEWRLNELSPNERLFHFDYPNALKIIRRLQQRSGVICSPNGENVTWKDLRSGMACDLLRKGWTTDQVNARLGHKPSSKEIDKYINFLALDRHTGKAKSEEYEIGMLRRDVEKHKSRERVLSMQLEEVSGKVQILESKLQTVLRQVAGMRFEESE